MISKVDVEFWITFIIVVYLLITLIWVIYNEVND